MKSLLCYSRRLVLLLAVLTALIGLAYFLLRNNIHTVIPGQVYRSAQLSARKFNQLIHQYQIRSIINLRGENEAFPSYRDEIKVAQEDQVNHYDLALSSLKLPSPANFQTLVSLLQTVPGPILVHCLNGADRSGLASAIALELNGETSLERVKQQFSIRYFVLDSQSVGKQVFKFYEQWLNKNNLKNTKENFLRWAYLPNPFRG